MKYRIVPCIGSKLYYKIQIKKFWGWSDLSYDAYEVFIEKRPTTFPTIKFAQEDMLENYGKEVKQVDFELG